MVAVLDTLFIAQSASVGDSRTWFTALVGLVALQRVAELFLSTRNSRKQIDLGGVEHGRDHLPAMVAVHTSFLIACPLEVWLLNRPFVPWLGASMLVLLLLAQLLRYWTISTLGSRWTVRVIVRPGFDLVDSGPYRWLSHPNYVAVVLEIVAIPLIHTAWLSASVFTLLNAAVLTVRLRVENRALLGARKG